MLPQRRRKFLSNVANFTDCAIFLTFDTFKFPAENRVNFQRRDWAGVKLSRQSRKTNFLTLPDLSFSFVHKKSGNEITVTLVFQKVFSSTWQVFNRSEHENYLSTNILKTHLRRFQYTMNLFFLADKCKHCDKFFNQITDCMERKTHTGMKSYTCKYCKKAFSNSFVCKRHERTHAGEKPYTCKYCKKSFSNSSDCKRHERTHTGEKPYTCKYCERSFSCLSNCKTHERTHTGEKPYTCMYCKKSFSISSHCKRHERTHTGEKPYTCKYCKKCFSQLSHCRIHERTHTGQKPYTCKHCERSFKCLSNCKKHERTHTGEKPYTCKDCKKTFRFLSNCKQHERIHTGEKPYTCKQCKKSFSQLSHLRKHERTHTGEKPYTCKHCEKSFSNSSACKKHERTHTGEKPYTCKHCKKSFSELSNCKRHEERHARASLSQLETKKRSSGDLQESAVTLGGKKSCVLSSLTEENSSQVESLTCWICQKEFSSEACVIQHYDEHMRLKWRLYLRWFLAFALRILSAHNLWRHLAPARARAYWKHGGSALILSSVSWKMVIAHQWARPPQLFSSHFNRHIINFAWEKTHLISIAENWINKENSRYTVIFCFLSFGNHVKKFRWNLNQDFSFLSKPNLKTLFLSDTMYWPQFNAYSHQFWSQRFYN